VPYWATLPVAAVVCLVAGFLFGLPALRLEGLYLALATFALGVSLPALLKYHHLEKWTGGVQGIVINKPELEGQVEILHFGLRGRVLDRRGQHIGELSLLLDLREHRLLTLVKLQQVCPLFLDGADRHLVQARRGFLSIARDERHGRTFCQQANNGTHGGDWKLKGRCNFGGGIVVVNGRGWRVFVTGHDAQQLPQPRHAG
jgi:hypothetical protein